MSKIQKCLLPLFLVFVFLFTLTGCAENQDLPANKWLEEGNKVKVTVRFRGRQMAHVDLGEETLNKFIEMCDKGTTEKKAVLEGRNLFTILVPKKEK